MFINFSNYGYAESKNSEFNAILGNSKFLAHKVGVCENEQKSKTTNF